MILALVTVGKYLEARSKGKTGEAIAALIALAPESAVVIRDGKEVTLPIGEVVGRGHGHRPPGAGASRWTGWSSAETAPWTRSAMHRREPAGGERPGGQRHRRHHQQGRLPGGEATRVGKDTTLSQIITLMDEAASSKAPIAKLADKVSGIFVPTVITIAVAAGLLWYFVGHQSVSFSLSIAIAVLVISCPCALGLATPVAFMVGTGKAAQHGILIKSAEALEVLHPINTVVLDKTGTVTEGQPKVTDVFPAAGVDEAELLRLAGSAEVLSEHPLAQAIVEHVKEKNIPLSEASDFAATPGGGVEATVEGHRLFAGNRRLFDQKGVDLSAFDALAEGIAQEGKTPLFFVSDGKLLGMLALADTVEAHQRRRHRPVPETGDRRGPPHRGQPAHRRRHRAATGHPPCHRRGAAPGQGEVRSRPPGPGQEGGHGGATASTTPRPWPARTWASPSARGRISPSRAATWC